jgi:hypothetical protein
VPSMSSRKPRTVLSLSMPFILKTYSEKAWFLSLLPAESPGTFGVHKKRERLTCPEDYTWCEVR